MASLVSASTAFNNELLRDPQVRAPLCFMTFNWGQISLRDILGDKESWVIHTQGKMAEWLWRVTQDLHLTCHQTSRILVEQSAGVRIPVGLALSPVLGCNRLTINSSSQQLEYPFTF